MSYPAHYGPLATECGTLAMHTRQLSTSHALTGRTQAGAADRRCWELAIESLAVLAEPSRFGVLTKTTQNAQ